MRRGEKKKVMEPPAPRRQLSPRHSLGFLLAAGAIGIAGWAPQAALFDGNPRLPPAPLATTAPSAGATPDAALANVAALQSAQELTAPELRARPIVAAAVEAQAGERLPARPAQTVLMPTPRPASAPAAGRDTARHEKPVVSAQAAMLAQIAHMKTVLRLTADQEQYWPPVEAVLRDLARRQAAATGGGGSAGRAGSGVAKPGKITIGEADMHRLAAAAFPLLMTLREDQKRDAMQLARAMGLESVASAF
jgi:hypothetical protein